MSCFIHEDTTFERLLATCIDLETGHMWYLKDTPTRWVEALRLYNFKAFNERYPTNIEPIEEWIPRPSLPFTYVEAFKILDSIDYQCVDSKEYRESDTPRQVETIQLTLARRTICKLTEYAEASWG